MTDVPIDPPTGPVDPNNPPTKPKGRSHDKTTQDERTYESEPTSDQAAD